MTSAARDLMDTGTPGPWRAKPHGARRNCTCVMGGHVGETFVAYYVTDSDARKIDLSVNALPLVDALCEALADHIAASAYTSIGLTLVCGSCARYWPCPTSAARDALEAALRGEGDG